MSTEGILKISDLITVFETRNQYKISDDLKETIIYSDFIHLNQLNDIKNQIYNHISFIGNYSNLFSVECSELKNKNTTLENAINYVYLDKQLNTNEFTPNHTPHSFPCKYVKNLNDVFNGMVKQLDYYILLNTNDEKLQNNVYAYHKTYSKEKDTNYIFLVLIGKIINPTPYKQEQVLQFETKYNLKLSSEIKTYLQQTLKIFGLEIDKKKQIYYVNLNGTDDLYTNLHKTFNINEFSNIKSFSFDLENYRKPLQNIWEKSILEELNETDLNKHNKIMKELKIKNENFLNGFMKIGTVENQKFLYSELNQDLVLELYVLLNVSEEDKELEGSVWFHQLSDPGNATNKDLNYLPIRKMLHIGKIYQFSN